jgi:replication fork clamp-binding protein CrfC
MDNEFLDHVEEDLNDNSNEPATRGDVRNLALRVELRFTKLESSIDQRFTKLESSIDQRFTKLDSSINERFTKLDSSINERFSTHDSSIKEYVYQLGWKFFGATIGTMGAMFTVFGIFINSSMK